MKAYFSSPQMFYIAPPSSQKTTPFQGDSKMVSLTMKNLL
jgi:hypothetical protein